MVKISLLLLNKAPRKRFRSGFLDSVRIHVKGGTGGNGFPKFGGIGGRGGDIYIVGKKDAILKDILKKFPSKRVAGGLGESSRSYRILGTPGEDVKIPVPLGVTLVTDQGIVLGEINSEDDKVLVAFGGDGGNPKNQYAGQKGFARSVTFDLKLIADVGFVGFPNAGKSTLLKALSRATPKIASYPFTTIKPNVGVVEYNDFRQISLADLPGLIEGAHLNFGMGHRFLKHVVRTKLLLFVVDVNGFRLNPQAHFRNAFETIMLLNKELELYKENLIDKPAMLVITKMDTEGAEAKLDECLRRLENANENSKSLPDDIKPNRIVNFDKILPISSESGYNLSNLKNSIRDTIDINFDRSSNQENVAQSFLSLSKPDQKNSDLKIV